MLSIKLKNFSVLRILKRLTNKIISPLNIKISKLENQNSFFYPVEATKKDIEIMNYVLSPEDNRRRLSMVSSDRLWAVIQATKYIIKNEIEGDFIECGVWRGGCSLAMAMVLDDLKADRKIFLYDTFAGMTKPTKHDINYQENSAINKFEKTKRDNDSSDWCFASIEDVKEQFKKVGLEEKAIFIKGDVLKTLKEENNLPKKISLLRLDTDWYESTKYEMEILFPKLQKNGVLLIDDYGHWKGSRKAVDEYLTKYDLIYRCLMWKTDYTGRGLIKK